MGVQCTLFNLCFFCYAWLVPVFLQYLMQAPSTFDSAPFYPVPIRTLHGDVPHLTMSSFPQTTSKGINHCRPCSEDNQHKSGMYQWDVMVSISYKDLLHHNLKKPVSTMYPVLFASNDGKKWKVVADAEDVAKHDSILTQSRERRQEEPTHISAPLLVANLKNFGCVDDEVASTDPFISQFPDASKARFYKWKLHKHVAMHGSVNLVACVMQGMDSINTLIHEYIDKCLQKGGEEMKCHMSPKQALQQCFALGTACGQACGIFTPKSPSCKDGTLDPVLFEGLTKRRVKIKTSPGGGGAAESLVYCSKEPCKTGLHFKNMYVEAENPVEFLEAQRDVTNKEKGSYYVLMLAMSDFHPPTHTFKLKVSHHTVDHSHSHHSDDSDESEHDHSSHSGHHDLTHHKGDKDHHDTHHKGDKHEPHKPDEHHKKPHPKKAEERTCVDLPGVRLSQIDHTGLAQPKVKGALGCTAECGKREACKMSIFSSANEGCYLFKLATVEVDDFSDLYNSSFCGPSDTEDDMMTMLHQAYKGYVPTAAPGAAGAPASVRVLSEAPVPRALSEAPGPSSKFYWQIAHVPNLTIGVLRDTGSDSVRVLPRNGSCFTAPGFAYLVACMTAKPVYMSGKTYPLEPPPFNDRCLAVGGLCGATCGSGQELTDGGAKACRLEDAGRRLQGTMYASASVPHDLVVQRIEPRRSATQRSFAARVFFHMFIFFIAISYIATILSKFPGNFTDFYPMHTWDEIRTHGYVLEKFGCAVSCGCSAGEGKLTVVRNWIGKIASRPQFDDAAFPTFSRWVDAFCDEGHREGARLLWVAWTDFLDTSPPFEFLEQWSQNLQNVSWDQAIERSPFDLKWKDAKVRRVLPVVPEQATTFLKDDEEVLEGGIFLEQDSLAKLVDLAALFKLLPENLRLEPGLPINDDVILTRSVKVGLIEDDENKQASSCFSISFSATWQKEVDQKVKGRLEELGLKSKDEYEKSLTVTDKHGKAVKLERGSYTATEQQFPLHFREPPTRLDRQVIMIYCARAKPETEREGIDKTRTLDKYLWACLRPSAVKGNGKAKPKRRNSEEQMPLLERSWSSVTGTEVRKNVEGVLERQNEKFLASLGTDEPTRKGVSGSLHREYAKAYLKYRTVDSDWEMARYCYGEIVGEDRDVDGDEVLILDNPSPSLLELISDLYSSGSQGQSKGMGLVSAEGAQESNWCGITKTMKHSFATKPSLEFIIVNTDPSRKVSDSELQQDFRKKLKECLSNPKPDVSGLSFKQTTRDGDNIVEVSGPGKLIELIREQNPKNLQVLSYMGRMVDSHPTVMVKKDLLMPFIGVRGKSGGLNFIVDLLQFREGFIGTGDESDVTPDRMLFGIFDARHQPHPDFWRHCLPKFMNNTDMGYTYEVNDQVCMVQAPQSFALVAIEEDILDVLNGMTFNIMNVIRNRCGGVTSCGTNAIWQINASEFDRREDDAVLNEYFDSRTKIEDTASTHINFCRGKRSVYVQEKISTGIAKLNADYLCAMQRWAEGAVQLFWLQLFRDKTLPLVIFGLSVLAFLGMLYVSLYGSWTKGLIGYNLFCDAEGVETLLTGSYHPFCMGMYDLFGHFLFHTIDKVMFQMAEEQYMRLIDFAIAWFFVLLGTAVICIFLSYRGSMPRIVRTFIMMENISYWLTSCSIFFWVSLTLFMIIFSEPPLMFNVTHFMLFVLGLNITQHSMINEYKDLGGADEASIWRSQQSYTLAAPLYIMAIVRGTGAAWGIIWHRLDKSFWSSSDHGADIIIGVTLWVTFIWVAFVFCVSYALIIALRSWIAEEVGNSIHQQCQLGALCLLGFLAITVWEPFLALWGLNKTIDQMSKDKDDSRRVARWITGLMLWWRGRAWIMRYIIDFGMPILVFSGVLGGGVSLISVATYATTVHGFRG